ncbi:GTPase-activating protein CdGAPr isoform X3 [Bombyx mandarina]|uniref:GTPase-activating protein CdGAPr isoform X3 n=1 Tax=Bombyx mandarina TaxID=7092 RepID=A0A6J2JZW7_BOMMA|nr:GTPase-activating protein CdGAPr isoform X3 [Bombyx mandarina]
MADGVLSTLNNNDFWCLDTMLGDCEVYCWPGEAIDRHLAMIVAGSPHGSVMSCQSLATRAFVDSEKDAMTQCATFHRSVRFSSDSRSSTRHTADLECKRENSGSTSLTALAPTPVSQGSMSQSAPAAANTFDLESPTGGGGACRFPKLEECAHFHYERVALGGLALLALPGDERAADSGDEGWICIQVRSHVSSPQESEGRQWTLMRNRDNLLQLDDLLHRCIYDRKVSGLPNLTEKLSGPLPPEEEYHRLIADYLHHLSIIADDSINCGPVLYWMQMDNKGQRLLVANEDSSSINTPAVAAAYSVRKYVSQARDEISFEVGDMISIIDMPGPQESVWWRGKRGFRVGFFPRACVAVIGDKVPRHMTQPPPIVGSVAMAPIKPVLRKHGKLISLFRSFILSRPSRRSLKQQGILKERVFGCDLGEHLLNCGHDVPVVLVECAEAIESAGAVDGVYRLSGGAGLTQRLRDAFDAGRPPDLRPAAATDPHAVPSLLKMYFRELPNPLCTYQLYESFVRAVQQPDEASRLAAVRDTVVKLPPPHFRTMAYLMRHLRRVSLQSASTGMTARNVAIVWAPNLLRAPRPQHALHGVAVQAVVTEFLICYAEELFAREQGAAPPSPEQTPEPEPAIEFRGMEPVRRPKSLPVTQHTKLLSLEEARRRGRPPAPHSAPPVPPADPTPVLRPQGDVKPKYIEVGSGPNNLPQYHTVLELPATGRKRGVKRSPSGWRGIFTRNKQRPADTPTLAMEESSAIKSCESLSDGEPAAPGDRPATPAPRQHARSSSCDSYFEPWQAELAGMRLRLCAQERDQHIFSEEDDTAVRQQEESASSSPPESGLSSVEPSPRRSLRVDIKAANEYANKSDSAEHLQYIDAESPRRAPPEKRLHQNTHDQVKRVCRDRADPRDPRNELPEDPPRNPPPCIPDEPPRAPTAAPPAAAPPASAVKLRERSSPRRMRNGRYSGVHHCSDDRNVTINRLSWHGKDGHSTLIKIDWPIENISVGNLTTSTLNSSPLTPTTPLYGPLESDSEHSDSNKRTIRVSDGACEGCVDEKCLKCELRGAERGRTHAKVMTSSHESSSSYSNSLQQDELYECCTRPDYINLQSSSTSKSSPGSPLKSPLKSTISITFRSPTRDSDGAEGASSDSRDSVYEDIDLEKNLSIVEDAPVPQKDASLPTQQACQPQDFVQDLIILETPLETHFDADLYSQVKFFKQSIEEVNALVSDAPAADRHYENVRFQPATNDYENINVRDAVDSRLGTDEGDADLAPHTENGNVDESKNLNVRELAVRFESPTEQRQAFTFQKFKAEIKYPSLERDEPPGTRRPPGSGRLSRGAGNARSLDESAFTKEFGDRTYVDRRKSLEMNLKKKLPDLNLNIQEVEAKGGTTPATENKISLVQRFHEKRKTDIKTLIGVDTERKLSRERIEKYKEERRMFLREKYSSQSFRSSPEQLTRIKIKKDDCRIDDLPKFERRNTVDLGQRMRYSLARGSPDPALPAAPPSPEDKLSPHSIRDMAALFEHKSQRTG